MSMTYDNLHTAYFPAEYADILMDVLAITPSNFLSVKDAFYHFSKLSDDQAAEVMEHIADRAETEIASKIATRLIVPSGSRLAAGRLYLRLFHGRNDPSEEMNDWGFNGPTFGPLISVVQTYSSTTRLISQRDELWLNQHEDMIVWEGCYYGDFAVFVASETDKAEGK